MLNIQDCDYGLQTFGFSDNVPQQKRTVRFIKMRIESYYGEGGGLRYFSVAGPFAKPGI